MRTLCAWCGEREKVGGVWGPVVVPAPGSGERVSHGMCPACAEQFEADMRENPGVPHGTFAKLRRAAVRRGASDPDAYAATVERRMMGKNGALSEGNNLRASLVDLDAVRDIVAAAARSPQARAIVERLDRVIPTLRELAEQAERGVHRNPTLAILGNPGRKKLARKVLVIDYVHASNGKKYTHDFGEDRDHGPVVAFVEDGGKRVILEAEDGRAIVRDY